MIRFTKFCLAAALIGAPVLAAANPVDAWAAAVGARVSANLRDPADQRERVGRSEVALVALEFTLGADRRATDIAQVGGDPGLVRTATAALEAVGKLPPLPAGVESAQPIRLEVLIAGPRGNLRAARRVQIAQRQAKNAAFAARNPGIGDLAMASASPR